MSLYIISNIYIYILAEDRSIKGQKPPEKMLRPTDPDHRGIERPLPEGCGATGAFHGKQGRRSQVIWRI